MIAIFLLAVTAIVAVVAFLIFKTTKRNEPALVGIGAMLFFVFFLAIFGHTFVKNQHVGYSKVFGVVQQGRTIQPGFQLKAPWEEVKQVDTSVGTMTFSGAKGGYALLEGLTSDGILIRVDLATSWAVVPSCVPAFKTVFGVDGRYEDQVYSIIRSAARDVLAETSWKSGAILNRDLFTTALQNKIELKTKQFFAEAGLPNCAVVRYGAAHVLDATKAWAERKNIPMKVAGPAIRAALTGRVTAPDLGTILVALGAPLAIKRISTALEA